MEELFSIDTNHSGLLFSYEYSLRILRYLSDTEEL